MRFALSRSPLSKPFQKTIRRPIQPLRGRASKPRFEPPDTGARTDTRGSSLLNRTSPSRIASARTPKAATHRPAAHHPAPSQPTPLLLERLLTSRTVPSPPPPPSLPPEPANPRPPHARFPEQPSGTQPESSHGTDRQIKHEALRPRSAALTSRPHSPGGPRRLADCRRSVPPGPARIQQTRREVLPGAEWPFLGVLWRNAISPTPRSGCRPVYGPLGGSSVSIVQLHDADLAPLGTD